MCRHVQLDEGPGWHDSESDELCPDAWCDACERLRLESDGWTDEASASADIRVVCAHCYHRLRGRRLRAPELEPAADEEVVEEAARAVMARRNEAMKDAFSTGRYWYDLDAAELEFRDADERPVLICRVVMLGTYSESGGTWLAGWKNRGCPAASTAPSAAVTGWLEAHELDGLADPNPACSLVDAWGLAAVGAAVLDAVGLYRCPSERIHVFFALLDAHPA